MVTLEFDFFPISVNKLYVNIPGQGRRFISAEGKRFKQLVETSVKTAIDPSSNILSEYAGKRLDIDITIESPSWVLKDGKTIRKKDLDNLTKALQDSIFNAFNELGFCLDDAQIWTQTLHKVVALTDRTIVTLKLLEE